MTFDDLVLDWLKTRGDKPQAAKLVKVEGFGNDMAGDTEGGFYETFRVTVYYIDEGGETRATWVNGEAMASLWDHVVKSWPVSGRSGRSADGPPADAEQ